MGEVYLKLDQCNPTHSFKDRVVGVASAKAIEVGADTLACASTGNLGNAVAGRAASLGLRSVVLYPRTVEAEKLRATAVYGGEMVAVRGSYDDCSRLVVELAAELDWAFVNVNLRAYYAEGSKTIAFEVAEQLGWELPDVVVSPIASGSLFTKLWQGFEQLVRVGLVEGEMPRLHGGQAAGCSPGRRRVLGRARRFARTSADDRALARDRRSGRRRPCRRHRRASGGSIHAVPEEEVGENMKLLAGASGVFGETATGVALGALRDAVARGQIGGDDRVVVLVTGTGLKTPDAVGERPSREIDADVDELLAELEVAA